VIFMLLWTVAGQAQDRPPHHDGFIAGQTVAIGGALASTTVGTFVVAYPWETDHAPYITLGVSDLLAPVGPFGALSSAIAVRNAGGWVSITPAALGIFATSLPLVGLALTLTDVGRVPLVVSAIASPIVSLLTTAVQVGMNQYEWDRVRWFHRSRETENQVIVRFQF